MFEQREAPFGLPMDSFKSWYRMLWMGVVLACFIMGLVYRYSKASFIGTVSVAELTGVMFAVAWMVGVVGPLSPFAYTEVEHDV